MFASQRGGFSGKNLYISHNKGFDIFSVADIKHGISTSSYKLISNDFSNVWSFAVDADGNMTATAGNSGAYYLYYSTNGGNSWGTIRIGSNGGYTRYVEGARSSSFSKIFFVYPRNNSESNFGKLLFWTPQNPTTWYNVEWKLPDDSVPNEPIRNLWYCNGYYYTHVGTKMYRGTSINKGLNLITCPDCNILVNICYCYDKYWAITGDDYNTSGSSAVIDRGGKVYYSNDGLTWSSANINGFSGSPAVLIKVKNKLYVLSTIRGQKKMYIGLITSDMQFQGTELGNAELSENVYKTEISLFATKMEGNE